MKGKSKILLALALVVVSALCLYTACDKTPKTEVTITLGEKTEYELDLYEQVTLTATVTGTEEKVVWTTSDSAVASVEGGVVTALKQGSATITASAAGKSADCTIKVTPSGAVPQIVGINSSVTLKLGTTAKLSPQAEYKGSVIDVSFTYESEDPAVATVENGTITGVKTGKTTVFVRAAYFGYSMEEEVAVTVRDNVSINLDVSSLSLALSEPTEEFHSTHQLVPEITENGSPVTDLSKVTYTSSDENAVTVSEAGLVTAVAMPEDGGAVTVTAKYTSANGDLFDASVAVTVFKPEVAVGEEALVADINADTAKALELDISALFGYGVTADKVVSVTDVEKNASIGVSVSDGKLMLTKADIWSGGRTYRVETADAVYKMPVVMATKVINTAADIDKMGEYSEADKSTDLSKYQRGGYFLLGADIDYGGKTVPQWCGYAQNNSSTDTTTTGFIGTFDGQNHTISNMVIPGSNGGFIGTLNASGVFKNVAFANAKISENGSLICLLGGTVENVIVHGTKTGTSATWGSSGLLFGKIVNASATVNNVLVLSEAAPSDMDAVIYGKGDDGKAFKLTDVYGVCVEKQTVALSQGNAAAMTRVLVKATVDTLKNDDGASFERFSGWDMSFGVPMSDKIIEVISDKLLYEFYIEDTGELTVGENKLSANADGVSWSLKEPVDKVSINAETGVVTVEYGVADGAEVTVVAKKGEMQFERTFKVKASVREDKTAAISEYWDKSSSGAFALTLDELKGEGVSFLGMYDEDGGKLEATFADGTVTLGETADAALKAKDAGDYTYTVVANKDGVVTEYVVKAALVTKILTTAADLDSMAELSKADSTSDVAAYRFGGYFALGADIDYGGKVYASWCGYAQCDSSTDTVNRGFIGIFDGRNHTISNMKIEGGNNGFLGMVNEIGVVRNVAFANVQVSGNAGLFCVFGGTIENVIVHGSRSSASNDGWGRSGILIGKIVNAKAVVKNVVVIHNGAPLAAKDGIVYGTGDGGKPYALTDVYAVCAESQKIADEVGDKAVNTRVMAKASVEELAADESKSFAGFSGWDMSKGIPLSQAIIDVMYPAAE